MDTGLLFVIVVIVLSWLYDFYNGANDSANSIATTVSTRVLTPFKAVLLAAVLNFAGALVTTEVAKTIGKGLLPEQFMTPLVIISAVVGALAWAAFATHRGIPVSITHVMSSAIMGVGSAQRVSAVRWVIAGNIVIAWILTIPVAGLTATGVYYLLEAIVG